jgi:hypothetical protein
MGTVGKGEQNMFERKDGIRAVKVFGYCSKLFVFTSPYTKAIAARVSRDNSVVQRWATCWMIGLRVPVGAGIFSLHRHIQTGSGAHPASYPVGTRGYFTGDKATGT